MITKNKAYKAMISCEVNNKFTKDNRWDQGLISNEV